MTSAVDSTATIDDESTSNTLKRRRSSSINQNEIDIEQTPSKRVRSSSSTNNSTSDNNNNVQSMFSCLNDMVQSHRNLVREYVDLQMCNRPDLSLDEQRFIQAEEDLIEKVEKNLHDTNHIPSTPPSRNGKRQRCQSINSTNQSFDRVKHETHILKRIDELKSDGKWTNQRLAKCLEPNKRKTHWDYLLDEMRWLAEDFLLEKRWKQVMAKKLSLAVLKYFRDKNQAENQQKREQIKHLRQQAQFICEEVMIFWRNVHKISEYKETKRLEELRKHQLDSNFIVDQSDQDSDDDNDEETIEREEQNEPDEYDLNELKELEADQQQSVDVLLKCHYGIDLSNLSNEKENNLPEEEEEESSSDDETSETSDENDLTITEDFVENDLITSEKQINDLSTIAQSFQPTGFTLNTTSVKTPVPFLLKHPLREYQHVGLDWLVTLYENKLNCILADEIGLGKTIQTIALLAHLACEKSVWGPHLIIVPTNVMFNWELEFKKWCPAFKILTYYGTINERQDWSKINACHICITSYRLVIQDEKIFRRKKWRYLILDEAQNIKNFQSERWQTLLNFNSQRRLLLTGTSLQNSSIELWSLMHFLMPNLSTTDQELHEWFSNSFTETIEKEPMDTDDLILKRLHQILRPFILRRLKIDVENQMPTKHEHIIMCHLSKRQRELYENLIQCKSTRDIIEHGHYMSMINILMELKKVCNHPDLFQTRSILSPFVFEKELIKYEIPKLIDEINLKNPYLAFDYSSNDTFLCFRIQFTLQPTKDMIMEIINRENNHNENRQKIQLTTDIIQRYRNSSLWSQTNQITKNRIRNHSEIKQTNLNNEEFQPENIYHEICKQREEERLSRYEFLFEINSERCQSRPLYGCDILSQIELAMRPCHHLNRTTFSGYALCHTRNYLTTTDILQRLVKLNQEILDEYQDRFNRFVMYTTRVLASPIELYQSNGIRLTNKIIQQKPLIEVLSSTDFNVLSSLKQNIYLQFPEQKYLQYDCGKLQILNKLLSDLKQTKHRCLIYTQMTKMLDILELFLKSHSYTYLRLDGTTKLIEKQILTERFNTDEKIFVFILSTRTGRIGVNLTGADTVIFYDSDWNPTIHAQIKDRCHRIGQTKDVHIYRLINRNTIEENIFKKSNQKSLLGDSMIDENSFDINPFKKNNIQQLFDQSSIIQRNEYQEQLNFNHLTLTDDDLTVRQFEEVLTSVEDELDRQAIEELNREINNELNEDEIDNLNEYQQQRMNEIEEELNTLDQQLRPIERYALRCVETYRTDYQITPMVPNTYLDSEQIQKDWQLSRLKALKEQEEKRLEHEDDEMMYTYARDNERKVKYKYTYSPVQNSLVASELEHHEKSFTADHSYFFSPIPLSPVSISISTSLPPLSPPLLSPALIKRSSRTINNHLQTSNENVQRRRLQIVSSPPPILIQTETASRMNRNTDDCVDLTRLSCLSQSSSTTDANSSGRQQMLIVNSLESLGSLNKRTVITLIKSKSIINLFGQSSTSRSSSTTGTIWITEDGQAFEIWCGIIMKYSTDENEEIYNDDELDFGYESEAMIIEPEEYIRFPLPKALADTTNMSKSDTNILVPRSLFDRSNLLLNTQSSSLSTNTLNKSKQISNNNNNKLFPPTISTTPQANIKARQLYVNNGTTTTPLPNSSNTNVIVSASTSSRPIKLEEMLSKDNFQGLLEIDNSDWLISEDFKVLDTIQNIQQLPLSSMSFSSTSNANKPQSILPNSSLSSSPLLPSTTTTASSTSIVNNTTNALTQNWDFISDVVNRYSRVLRTPKQCKHRFEQVIGPREEGRVVYDLIKKKKHVIKGTVKMSDDNWQMLRTNQLFVHDNCQKLMQIYHQKFETISQFEQQFSSMMYLNKFKQMQIAQATHHQMRGLKQGSLLQENNINLDVPLIPSDVSYQRSEREKELKQQQLLQQQQQQQQQQQPPTQSVTANVHPQQQQQQQQQQTPTTPNNIDTVKQQTPSTNTTLPSAITSRVRPTSLNTTPTPTPINPSPSTPLSLIPACSPSTPTIQRSVSNNIIVASNNHPNMNPTRSQSNILPNQTNLSSSTPTSIKPIPSSSNQSSIPTATIVPGQRQVQVLPSNNISINETNQIQQKQVGTVQISSNDYRHVRTVPHQQQIPTTPPPSASSPSPTPTNLQVRTQNYQRNQAQAAALATLEVRSQLPPSPKSQPPQQQQPRPPSTTLRTPSITQPPAEFLIQSQTKSLTSSTSQSSLPVAVVRPMQHSSTSVAPTVSSPTSPLNLPSLNVTLPSNKLTTTSTANTTTNNPSQQLRTTTAFLSNQTQSTSQAQQIPQQIRQLFTNANNNSQTTNTQRLTEAAQRSPSSIQQIIASRTTSLPGQVRNVRILTFTPGTNPPTGIADTTTTGNTQQTPIQSTNIPYNRTNSSTSSFSRPTINIDQDISPDIAAQLHRIKSFNVTNTDPNDTTQTPRAVLVPARTISGSSTSSAGSASKIKSSSLIDPTTLGFTTKTSQANIVFQLPSTGGDDQTTNSSGLTRQNLIQHLNLISPNLNQRSQSPTTISNPTNSISVNRLLQQYQLRAALNSSTSSAQISSGQPNNEQISSSSPPPPSSSSSSSTT